MADLVEQVLQGARRDRRRAPFTVRRVITPSRGRDLTTVIATRPGQSDRRIVVLAHRDGPGLANLSGTAALLELARRAQVARAAQDARAGLDLGLDDRLRGCARVGEDAAGERGGRRDRARRHGRDEALQAVGGRLAAVHGADAARAGAHAAGLRPARDPRRGGRPARARPVGPARAADHGLRAGPDRRRGPARPCCSRSPASAARPPDEPVLDDRLEVFGKTALDAVGALDAAGPRDEPAFAGASSGIVTLRNVLPGLGRAADRRLAAAARAAGRARRVLPRPPPPRPDRAVGRLAGGRRRAAARRVAVAARARGRRA